MEVVDKKLMHMIRAIANKNFDNTLLDKPQIPFPTEPEEEKCTMKLKTLNADAKDLFLCKNGEILFRMEE